MQKSSLDQSEIVMPNRDGRLIAVFQWIGPPRLNFVSVWTRAPGCRQAAPLNRSNALRAIRKDPAWSEMTAIVTFDATLGWSILRFNSSIVVDNNRWVSAELTVTRVPWSSPATRRNRADEFSTGARRALLNQHLGINKCATFSSRRDDHGAQLLVFSTNDQTNI